MQVEFTPGAMRALLAATTWASTDVTCSDQLGVPEILLGLLDEPECRAALLLAKVGVDAATAQARFADLKGGEPSDAERLGRFTTDWTHCLIAGQDRLFEYPRPLTLATEHLLLCIMSADNEVSRWLSERGLSTAELEAEVHRLNGHRPGPLPIDEEDGLDALPVEETPPAEEEARELSAREQVDALRAIDAAANRAAEGLRVVEDYLRFVLDDRRLTSLCKSLRHQLAAALAPFSIAERHAARETQSDVGAQLSLPSEQSRASAGEVALASLKRVQQALRSLEEFSKLWEPPVARQLEQLRYQSYTLERAVGITADSLARLAGARLYVLIDGGPSTDAFRRQVNGLVSAGVDVLQLRDKRLPDRVLLERALLLAELTRETETLFVMNDRADLAVLAGADGVHVGQDELSVKDARRIRGPRGLVGVSTHSIEQARAAVLDGANYIGVGPTFPSGTKHFAAFTGVELLRAVAAEIRLPAFAIGGISLDNVAEVLATGIRRVAVSGAIAGAPDPEQAAARFKAVLSKY